MDFLKSNAKLMGELFIIYENAKKFGDWADPLDDYYEALASNSKKDAFGQYFTPKPICNLMANFVVNPKEWSKTPLKAIKKNWK